jgi:uncharacterized protein involved in outer membrane biogenesis
VKNTSKKKKARKRLIRIIVLIPVSLILLLSIALVVLYFQQDRLVKLTVKELNKQLPGELVVGGSSISAFENFPYVSIRMNKVQFYANKQKTGKPIYEAERMYVGFSLSDIWNQKYHVKTIVLRNGHLDLVQDHTGKLNIVEAIRRTPDTTAHTTDTAAAELDLDLKKIVLKSMKVSYLDQQSKQQLVANIERIQSSFRADSANIFADLKGNMVMDFTRPGDTTLFRNKHLETSLEFSYNKQTHLLKLPVGKLQLEEAVFNITGTADLEHGNMVDVKIKGDKPDFGQIFSFAPESVKKELGHFKYNGSLSFDCTVKGNIKDGELPLIELSFSCADAWIQNTEANKKLDSLAFTGYYTNGAKHSLETSELRILNMNAKPGKGIFKGNFVMRDFTDPHILMQVNSDLQLEFIGAFLGIKDLERITGQVILNMDFKELVDLSVPEKQIDKLTRGIQSELIVRNLTFRIPDYPHIVEKLNMHADMKNGFVNLDSFSFKVGNSDFNMKGSISDLPAIFHHQQKPVVVTLNANSKKIVFKELLAFDTARSNKAKEEIHNFNIGLSMQTSVNELLQPNPLPRGKFKIQNLHAAFKEYPHVFKDFGAELTIEDTTLRLREMSGHIDSSDIKFSSRVNNYALWFNKVKKGKIQIAFDLKSKRFAFREVLGKAAREFLPRGYRREMATNLWIRTKTDIRYDTVFKFANVKIANLSGELKKHPVKLDSISGIVKFNAGNFIRIDTLKGKIGRSDFDISMRLYTGKDTARMKKENFLQFTSNFLDVDEMSDYDFAPRAAKDTLSFSDLRTGTKVVRAKPSVHAQAFNIFKLPFIDFRATVKIGKIKFKRLWVKNAYANVRMHANHHLDLDTLYLDIAEGAIGAQAHFNGNNPEKIYLQSRIHVQDVNLEKLLLKLDYLGQDYVINKNIKGHLTGDITSYVQVYPDFTPLIDHSEAQLDVDVRDGVLVNFAPIHALSSYFKDKNLNMVRFDTLRNKFTFKNGALTFPNMNINSSLGFMEISGKQALNTQMEYFVRIPLKMVTQVGFRMLFGKKQEEVDPDQVDAIEYRNMDKRIRFLNLKISGTPDDYKVSLGKKKRT